MTDDQPALASRYVKHVAELLATITADNVPSTAEDVARRTSENARRLFKIP